MNELQSPMVRIAAINLYTLDVERLVGFYIGIGFRETFRSPKEGAPAHVEVTLDGFVMGIASVAPLSAEHGLTPDLGGRPIEIVIRADDTDTVYGHLLAAGATSLSAPHDFLERLRVAWVADPDGNPIRLVQRR